MTDTILQTVPLEAPWDDPRFRQLPGVRPLEADDWLRVDEVYAEQMALRISLLEGSRDKVVALVPGAEAAADEALWAAVAVAETRLGFRREGDALVCPDGRRVPVDATDPLGTLGRLFQEDICLMEKRGDVHCLTAAVLCFPSGWVLAEKIGHPLVRIHVPVPGYDENIARRVQRLFDGLQTGRPIWRANVLWHDDPSLFAPRREGTPRPPYGADPKYLRTERQCLVRLPETQAVVFSIHTTIVDAGGLTPERRAMLAHRPPKAD